MIQKTKPQEKRHATHYLEADHLQRLERHHDLHAAGSV